MSAGVCLLVLLLMVGNVFHTNDFIKDIQTGVGGAVDVK